jgi:hippurate hydrolase
MIERIKAEAEAIFKEVQAIRHQIHAHPELSFQEVETAKFIAEKLQFWGIPYEAGIAGTGIVALIKGKNADSKCIALRSELDALPITEANEIDYKSKNIGVMHACGHDVHSSCLLGAAYILNNMRNEWEGTVKLIFQPGEEKNPGGASLMIAAGVLENPKPEAIYALHVYPHLPCGSLGFRSGQYMASTDEIYITVKGKGGHAALPHLTIDPIAISAQLICNLQQIVSRKSNPLMPTVLSFGKIAGGTTTNVIPDKVEIEGTFRTMDEEWRYRAHQLIKEIAEDSCKAYGAEAEVTISVGYPVVYNDPKLTVDAENKAKEYLGHDQVKTLNLRMTADDFSFYGQHIPACYFRLGTSRNDEEFITPVHNAKFNIDENAMKIGTGMMAWLAYNALKP